MSEVWAILTRAVLGQELRKGGATISHASIVVRSSPIRMRVFSTVFTSSIWLQNLLDVITLIYNTDIVGRVRMRVIIACRASSIRVQNLDDILALI